MLEFESNQRELVSINDPTLDIHALEQRLAGAATVSYPDVWSNSCKTDEDCPNDASEATCPNDDDPCPQDAPEAICPNNYASFRQDTNA